jgi:hypothetical protein
MKRPLKALAWSAAGLVVLAGLIWLSSLLYWHVRITSSLKRWKQDRKGIVAHSFDTHEERAFLQFKAGCRALPYATAVLASSDDDPEFQEVLMEYLVSALSGPGPFSEETWSVLEERSRRWEFLASGLDLERRAKIADFLKWWGEHGREYHAWWKTWSPWCATPDGRR